MDPLIQILDFPDLYHLALTHRSFYFFCHHHLTQKKLLWLQQLSCSHLIIFGLEDPHPFQWYSDLLGITSHQRSLILPMDRNDIPIHRYQIHHLKLEYPKLYHHLHLMIRQSPQSLRNLDPLAQDFLLSKLQDVFAESSFQIFYTRIYLLSQDKEHHPFLEQIIWWLKEERPEEAWDDLFLYFQRQR